MDWLKVAEHLGFPAAVALLVLLRLEQRMGRVEHRLHQIALLLALAAGPAGAALVEELSGGNGNLTKKRRKGEVA